MSKMKDDIAKLLQSNSGANNLRQEENLLQQIMDVMNPYSVGWARWHDTATSTTPLSLVADSWTKIPNDGLGAKSRPNEFLPVGIDSLFNPATGQSDFSQLEIGSFILWDYSLEVTTISNNTVVQMRADYAIGSGENFKVAMSSPMQIKNAGTYLLGGTGIACLCSQEIIDNPSEFQVFSDIAGATAVVDFFHAVVFAA